MILIHKPATYLKSIKLIGLLLALLLVNLCVAQRVIDSLKSELIVAQSVDDELSILLDIAHEFNENNTDSAFKYLDVVKSRLIETQNNYISANYYKVYGSFLNKEYKNDLAISSFKTSIDLYIDSIEDIARVNNLIGNCYNDLYEYDSALHYYHLSIDNIDSTRYPSLLAANYNNMANVYDALNESDKALDYYFRAHKLFNSLNQKENEAIALGNIGLINIDLTLYDNAIRYIKKAVDIYLNTNNNYQLCSNYNSLGIVYRRLLQFDTAIYYTNIANEIAKKSNFEYILAQSSHNIGVIYLEMENYVEAGKYFKQSLSICKKLGIKQGEIFNLISIGKTYSKQEKYGLAEDYLIQSLELCEQSEYNSHNQEIYEALMSNYRDWGKYREALYYFQRFVNMKDSLDNIMKAQELTEIQTKYESEQKELENQKLKDENKLQEFVIFRQRILVFIAALIAAIAISVLIMIMSIRKKRKERIALLQAKNKLISDSSLQLKESNITKDKLFSIIAHDLRSPFTSLLGFSYLLKEEAEAGNFENVVSYSLQLSSVATNTYELIDNLLNWTRSQQNSIKPNPNPLNLLVLVSKVVQSIQVKANEKKISIITSIDETIEVVADKNMLQVIFRNLLSNALKFTYNGGKITIKCEEKPDLFVISVADNGQGMESEITDNLFLDTSGYSKIGTENEQGSGLGLMLVKDFVQRIDGTIWVESTPEKGSIFSFTIPKVVKN